MGQNDHKINKRTKYSSTKLIKFSELKNMQPPTSAMIEIILINDTVEFERIPF